MSATLEHASTGADRLHDDELWLLSFYRESEISGALFFGRIARTVRPGPLQADITRHFADEANHASYWNDCIRELGRDPLKLRTAYQDRYLEAAGVPANLMEVLAITHVFEKRVIGQYRRHLTFDGTPGPVRATLQRIMAEERWHIRYVRAALDDFSIRLGQDCVDEALRRFTHADQVVYERALEEYGEHAAFLGADLDGAQA